MLAQGGDPLEPPLARSPRDSVAAASAVLAQGGDPLEPPLACGPVPPSRGPLITL